MTVTILAVLAVVAASVAFIVSQRRRQAQATWADAVLVSDPARLAHFDALYAETVAWVRARRPDAVQAPARQLAFRMWPSSKVSPVGFGWGKVLSPGVILGDVHGTLLVRQALLDNDALVIHECKHAITGIPDHPAWLFSTDENS